MLLGLKGQVYSIYYSGVFIQKNKFSKKFHMFDSFQPTRLQNYIIKNPELF